MKYNDTEEYNSIQTGNTVYISGLAGKNYSYLNNKYGYVKEILLSNDKSRILYSAHVVLFSTNESCFVNFEYLFKVGKNLNNRDIKAMIWEEDPLTHFIFKKNIVQCQPLRDENGQFLAICEDLYSRTHVFLCSGIN